VDTISDFVSGTDSIELDHSIFKALGVGSLSADAFRSGVGAVAGGDATDRVIYDTTTGSLYYDADGSGAGVSVKVAELGAVALAASDIHIV